MEPVNPGSAPGPQYVAPGSAPAPGQYAPTKDDCNMAMLCHLASFAGMIIPFGDILGPLVMWLMKKDQSPFVDLHGKEAVNFHISMYLWMLLSLVLCLICVGFVLLLGLMVLDLVCTIIAAVRAINGREYRYPLSIRFLR